MKNLNEALKLISIENLIQIISNGIEMEKCTREAQSIIQDTDGRAGTQDRINDGRIFRLYLEELTYNKK